MVHTKLEKVNTIMNKDERRVYLETRLRNLKRTYNKLLQHADLTDETQQIKTLINETEQELAMI